MRRLSTDACLDKISRVIVGHSCAVFFGLLAFNLLLSVVGISTLMSRGRVFSEATEWDWSVWGKEAVVSRDMARVASEQIDAYRARQQQSSASAPLQERAEEADARMTLSMQFHAVDPREELFPPVNLQTMCEIENIVYSQPGYAGVCYNATKTPSGVYVAL